MLTTSYQSNLNRFLKPSSIAVVGGGIWGNLVISQCKKFGFLGDLWPIHANKKNIHSNFILRVQISLDAKLAEVLSYQGEKPLPFFMNQSKRQSFDEKLQQNKFLTEWLESIFVSGISGKEQISNLIDNV